MDDSDLLEGSESPDQAAFTERLKDEVEQWSSNTNEVFELSLRRGGKNVAQFKPEFTYPIFGEEESLFGYQGLKISLAFAAHNLKAHLDVTWKKKFPLETEEIKASDIRTPLQDFLPAAAFAEESHDTALADSHAQDFVPPGTLLQSYTIEDESFEVWCASLSDPRAKEMMENAQVLVPMFIEGGQELDLQSRWLTERWKVFFLYQIVDKEANTSPYVLAGFSTSYRVFHFPNRQHPSAADLALLELSAANFDAIVHKSSSEPTAETTDAPATPLKSPLDLPSRERISQFLILPPFQGSGHGAVLYNTMYTHLIAPANICELTVEDPNESFDDLRDACDMVYLRDNNEDFAALEINSQVEASKLKPQDPLPLDDIVDGATKERIRHASKIMPRQLGRLIEMQALSKIPANHRSASRITRKEKSSNKDDRAYFFWRLYVKERLFQHNRDALTQMDREERIQSLENHLENVQKDYERLIALAEKRARQANAISLHTNEPDRKSRKRKTVIDDDDDDEDEDSGADANRISEHGSSTKKTKLDHRPR